MNYVIGKGISSMADSILLFLGMILLINGAVGLSLKRLHTIVAGVLGGFITSLVAATILSTPMSKEWTGSMCVTGPVFYLPFGVISVYLIRRLHRAIPPLDIVTSESDNGEEHSEPQEERTIDE